MNIPDFITESEFYRQCINLYRISTAKIGYHLLGKPGNQLRVVIFAQGRTGSTLLESLLVSTGHFDKTRHGELLDRRNSLFRKKFPDPLAYINGLANFVRRHFLFHVKIYQLSNHQKTDPHSFLQTLNDSGWIIIFLRRKNKVNQALSNMVANIRGRAHKFDSDEENFTLRVSCRMLEKMVHHRIALDEKERQVLSGIDYLELVYEDDLEDSRNHQATANRVLDYLGLESKIIKTDLRKIMTRPLTDTITNYDEFIQCIRENNWDNYLRL